MATVSAAASHLASVEVLKRVKLTENEWDTRLDVAKKEAEATLERLRTEAAAAVRDAQTEADRDRVARVVESRAQTEAEAGAILAEGRQAADRALLGEGRRPADKRSEVLDAVLGAFGKD
jgi:vacuolar-type H+-ATPase subunit H